MSLEAQAVLLQLCLMTLSKDERMEAILLCEGLSQREVVETGAHAEHICIFIRQPVVRRQDTKFVY
jgi:hypothetical protein